MDKLAKYRKALVAGAGVLVSVLVVMFGQNDPRVLTLVQVLTAYGVFKVPNQR